MKHRKIRKMEGLVELEPFPQNLLKTLNNASTIGGASSPFDF